MSGETPENPAENPDNEPRELEFTTTRAALSSIENMGDNRAYYTFDGDLRQMGIIRAFLEQRGMRVVNNNVYPGFEKNREEDYIEALRLLFEHKVEGWFNQKTDLIEHGICTAEEFKTALDEQVERGKEI